MAMSPSWAGSAPVVACAVWRSRADAALHAAAGGRAGAGGAPGSAAGGGWRSCSASAGVRGMWRGTWRTRRTGSRSAGVADRALGRALRHWWRVASVGARGGLRAERGPGGTPPDASAHAPRSLASAQHSMPLALKKMVPGPRRPVSKKVVVPGTPYGDGREMLHAEEGLSGLHPPPHRPTAPTQSPLCRPSQIPVFPKSTVRV